MNSGVSGFHYRNTNLTDWDWDGNANLTLALQCLQWSSL